MAQSTHIMRLLFLFEIAIFRQKVLASGQNIAQFLNISTFLSDRPTFSQIWLQTLLPLVDDHQPTYLKKLKKKKKKKKTLNRT
jgi:hypothetical protein